MSIDRSARSRLSGLVAQLASGATTNFDFEDAVPASGDPAVAAVAAAVWRYYDDLHEHALNGRFALDPNGCAMFERVGRFLATDLEYRWRHPFLLDLVYLPLGVLSLGLVPRLIERMRHPRWFDHVWPFSNPAENESTMDAPR